MLTFHVKKKKESGIIGRAGLDAEQQGGIPHRIATRSISKVPTNEVGQNAEYHFSKVIYNQYYKSVTF